MKIQKYNTNSYNYKVPLQLVRSVILAKDRQIQSMFRLGGRVEIDSALYDIFYTIMVHHQELSYYVMINTPPYVAMYKDVKCNNFM